MQQIIKIPYESTVYFLCIRVQKNDTVNIDRDQLSFTLIHACSVILSTWGSVN